MSRAGLGVLAATLRRTFAGTAARNRLVSIKTNDEFAVKVMNSVNPVIVNFHASWCEPCNILTTRLNEMVGPMEAIDLATVNVEDHAELVQTFEVKAVPAVVAIRDGIVVSKFIGLDDLDKVDKMIDDLTKKIS